MIEQIKQALDKATPGPWEVMNSRDIFTLGGATNQNGIKADDNDGWHIADTMCGPTNVNGEEWEMRYEERYANAHLIANAPEWLRYLITEVEAAKGNALLWRDKATKHQRAVEEMQKTLDEAKRYLSNDNAGYAEYIINQALKEDKPNEIHGHTQGVSQDSQE